MEILNNPRVRRSKNSTNEVSSLEEVKKPRKSTKRDHWLESEKANFFWSMRTHGKDWQKASSIIGTKSVYQIRNYACYLKENLMKNKK